MVAAGRAHVGATHTGTSYDSDLSASRLVTMAEQLEHAASLEWPASWRDGVSAGSPGLRDGTL